MRSGIRSAGLCWIAKAQLNPVRNHYVLSRPTVTLRLRRRNGVFEYSHADSQALSDRRLGPKRLNPGSPADHGQLHSG